MSEKIEESNFIRKEIKRKKLEIRELKKEVRLLECCLKRLYE